MDRGQCAAVRTFSISNRGIAMFARKCVLSLMVAFVNLISFALDNVEVTDVKARQRYPWNGKVDIDFTLDSKPTEPYQMQVEVYDNVGKTNLPVRSVCTEGVSVEANPCMVRTDTSRIVWDAAKDLPNGFKCTNVLVTCRDSRTLSVSNLYCVIDLKTGAKEYLDKIPKGGWTDEHKTTKMVFRRIEAGSFMMGSPADEVGRQSNETQHKVTITKPYYIGIYELTEAQYCQICGGESASMLPKLLKYGEVRGYDVKPDYYGSPIATEYTWPQSKSVDPNSLVGKLRTITSITTIDLPTEAQWEMSCKASTLTALNNGKESATNNVMEVGRSAYNAEDKKGDASSVTTTCVGCYMPNSIGLYDMLGNAREWCLDSWQESLGVGDVVDPEGKSSLTLEQTKYGPNDYYWYSCRVVKGGGFYGWTFFHYIGANASYGYVIKVIDGLIGCRSAWRSYGNTSVAASGEVLNSRLSVTHEGVRLVFSAE